MVPHVISISEPENVEASLPSREEGSSSWGGCRLEIEEEQRISAIPALCSVKRRKIPTAGSAGKKIESEHKQSARRGPQEM